MSAISPFFPQQNPLYGSRARMEEELLTAYLLGIGPQNSFGGAGQVDPFMLAYLRSLEAANTMPQLGLNFNQGTAFNQDPTVADLLRMYGIDPVLVAQLERQQNVNPLRQQIERNALTGEVVEENEGPGVGGRIAGAGIGAGIGFLLGGPLGALIGGGIGGFAKEIGSGIGTVASGIGKGIGTVAEGIGKGIGAVAEGIGSGVRAIGEGAVNVVKGVGEGVVNVAKGIGKGIASVGKGIVNGLKKIF